MVQVTKEPVAIKSVLRSKLTKKLLENLASEINILKGIRHDNIVALVDCRVRGTVHFIKVLREVLSSEQTPPDLDPHPFLTGNRVTYPSCHGVLLPR